MIDEVETSLLRLPRPADGRASPLELQMISCSPTSILPTNVPEPEQAASLTVINTCFGATDERASRDSGRPDEPAACALSGRALNVLKLLAVELTGESPAKNWIPSTALLREVTFERLFNARNCGPLTIDEIVRWAGSRGVTIAPRSYVGKSLPEMWHELVVKFAAGKLTQDQIAGAFERSVRRKSTKVPLAVQRVLVRLLGQPGKGPPRS